MLCPCFAVQYFVSFLRLFAVVSLGGGGERERERAGCLRLLTYQCYVAVFVPFLFLTVPWLWSVAFLGHTRLRFGPTEIFCLTTG